MLINYSFYDSHVSSGGQIQLQEVTPVKYKRILSLSNQYENHCVRGCFCGGLERKDLDNNTEIVVSRAEPYDL